VLYKTCVGWTAALAGCRIVDCWQLRCVGGSRVALSAPTRTGCLFETARASALDASTERDGWSVRALLNQQACVTQCYHTYERARLRLRVPQSRGLTSTRLDEAALAFD